MSDDPGGWGGEGEAAEMASSGRLALVYTVNAGLDIQILLSRTVNHERLLP